MTPSWLNTLYLMGGVAPSVFSIFSSAFGSFAHTSFLLGRDARRHNIIDDDDDATAEEEESSTILATRPKGNATLMNDDDDAIAEEEESCERTRAFALRTHLRDGCHHRITTND